MKKIFTISLILCSGLFANELYANTNDHNTSATKSTPGAKENLATNNGDKDKKTQESQEAQPTNAAEFKEKAPVKDTTEMNSVSKFNYIFYFIYKMKYDDKGVGKGYLELEL